MEEATAKQEATKRLGYEPIITKRIENVILALTLDTRKGGKVLPVAVRATYNNRCYYYRTGYCITLKDGKNSLQEWETISKAKGSGTIKENSVYATLYQKHILYS